MASMYTFAEKSASMCPSEHGQRCMSPAEAPHSCSDVPMVPWELSQCQLLFASRNQSLDCCCRQRCSQGSSRATVCKSHIMDSTSWSMKHGAPSSQSCQLQPA